MPSTPPNPFSRPYADTRRQPQPQPQQYLPIHSMEQGAFNSFNAMAAEPTLDGFDVSPDLPWQQWWPPDQPALVSPLQDSDGMTPSSAQASFMPNGYPGGYETSSLDYSTWPSPSTVYTPMTFVGEQNAFTPANPAPAPAQQEPRGRKRSSVERDDVIEPMSPPDSKHSKSPRGSGPSNQVDDGNNSENSPKKKARRTRVKVSKADGGGDIQQFATGSPSEQPEPATTLLQRRNRIASNKFRLRKKQDKLRLMLEEEKLKRVNRELVESREELTHRYYNLKMEVLRHSKCDCSDIQRYISLEAHRFVRGIVGRSPPPCAFHGH
ncbi:hypothetical protein QQZ08_008842 [Neonectria magnoliae]|uniref:BZIP domain-containing protein n=1 Tax=Neonectria magnoliae TaxID=2732573 RepID=A0ABR1HSJ6_9HYPO